MLSLLLIAVLADSDEAMVGRISDSGRYLKSAITLYEGLHYELALSQVKKSRLRAKTPNDEVQAELLAGIVFADWGKPQKATLAFERGFSLDTNASLPLAVSPKIVSMAEAVRLKVKKREPLREARSEWKPPGTDCPQATKGPQAFWNETIRTRLLAVLRKPDRPQVSAISAGLVNRLSSWVDGWIDQQLALCLSRDLAREPIEALRWRSKCLEQQAETFSSFVSSLHSQALPTADFGNSLPNTAHCASPGKETVEKADAAAPARRLLASALSKLDLGEYSDANVQLQDAMKASQHVGSPLLDAELKMSAGRLAIARQENQNAVEQYHAAVVTAVEADAPRLAIEALINLVGIHSRTRDFVSASQCQRWAKRLLGRISEHELLEGQLDVVWALLLSENGKSQQAVRTAKSALSTLEKVEVTPAVMRTKAMAYRALGAAHYELGNRSGKEAQAESHYAAARESFQKSLEQIIQHFGPSAPELVPSWSNFSVMLLDNQSTYAQAEQLLVDAVALAEKLGVPEADARVNLGQIYLLTGRLPLAETQFRIATETLEKTRGPEHPDLWVGLQLWGVALREMGQPEKAVNLHRRAQAIGQQLASEAHPDGPSNANDAMIQLGLDYLRLGEVAKLPTALEACDAARREGSLYPDYTLHCEYMRQQLAWAMGERKQAIEGMRRILKVRKGEGRGLVATYCEKIRVDVRTWLATHAN